MSITITIDRGSEWGMFLNTEAYADWGNTGEGADWEAINRMLGDLVVRRFEEIAAEHGYPVSWIPASSELIGDITLDLTGADFTSWRKQAIEEIWDQWVSGDIDPIMI